MEDEQRWKEALHATWTTPEQVVDGLVLRACGADVAARERIIGGEGNEVWSIRTRADDDLIVRIAHQATFGAERWATEHARRAGAPVPEVLLVDDAVEAGERRVAAWIHRRIDGAPFYSVTDDAEALRLTEEAGERLALVHSVPTTGYGWLDAGGRAPFDDQSAALMWDADAVEWAVGLGIERADVEEAAGLLAANRGIWSAPRLLHGDWLPEHVLVRDGAVAGIIDLGGARSGDPAYDIAYWQFFWDSERFPEAAIVTGYRRAVDAGPWLELRIRLCRLAISMRLLALYAQHGRDYPARHSATRFDEALAWLRANPGPSV